MVDPCTESSHTGSGTRFDVTQASTHQSSHRDSGNVAPSSDPPYTAYVATKDGGGNTSVQSVSSTAPLRFFVIDPSNRSTVPQFQENQGSVSSSQAESTFQPAGTAFEDPACQQQFEKISQSEHAKAKVEEALSRIAARGSNSPPAI
ncbi:hypothetical protein IAU59_001590 [Kwoniella sp. CBS 9459]